jgi:FkbM family methyltransferase
MRRLPPPRLGPRLLAGRILWRTGLCRRLLITTDLYRLRFFPTALSCALWTDPRARQSDEDFYRRYLRRDDTVVDVGANVGTLALAAAALVGAGGRVFAIEAHPRTYRYLLENIALNGCENVSAVHAAVGDKRALISFSDGRLDDQNHVDKGGPLAVPVERLDDLVPARPVHLLKIDVEGYELFVLRGAATLLAGTECVYFECSEKGYARYGYGVSDVLSLLDREGFTVWEKGGAGLSPFVSPRGDHQNLVAVRVGSNAVARLGLAENSQSARQHYNQHHEVSRRRVGDRGSTPCAEIRDIVMRARA